MQVFLLADVDQVLVTSPTAPGHGRWRRDLRLMGILLRNQVQGGGASRAAPTRARIRAA